MKKRIFTLILCLALAISLCAPAVAADTDQKTGQDYIAGLVDLADVLSYFHINSSDNPDPIGRALGKMFEENPEFYDEFAEKMFQLYDDYSHYIPPSEYDLSYPKSNHYAGIGVQLSDVETDRLVISSALPGSPAEAAGIMPGDEIVEIGGKNVEGLVYDEVTPLLRGDVGTSVSVGVRRNEKPGILRFTITRAEIAVSNIYFEDMGDKTAYISITRFGDEKTAEDFIGIYDKLGENGFEACVIDVRDNPGGGMGVLFDILNHICPQKNVNLFAEKGAGFAEVYRSEGKAVFVPKKLVVLVNENSASASEIFAGSIKENGLGTVVGVTTHGKGFSQVHWTMDDGSTAVVTVAEMLLPISLGYDKKGVEPDIRVEMKKVPYPMPVFSPLEKKQMNQGDKSENVLALEQRLHELGYLTSAPDDVFDERTLKAVNALRRDEKLPEASYVTSNTVVLVENAIARLSQKQVWKDTQLEKALELAKGASAKN